MGSTIAGGNHNSIGRASTHAAIGGGKDNNIAANSFYSAIAGGFLNDIGTNSEYSAIGGGNGNAMGTNSAFSTIAGGNLNVIGRNSRYATIPGGQSNFATNRAFAAGTHARAEHTGAFVWADSSLVNIASTNADSVTMRANGGYRLFSDSNLLAGVFLESGGGSWTAISDRNAKENFQPVNPQAVLDKVTALPLSTWNYKSQATNVRHIGPMAQDFKAAFGLGETETGITSVDADGVALAAIQGLNQKIETENRSLRSELRVKDSELQSLKQRLTDLETLVRKITNDQN
jgi:hypothetical protein